MKRVVVFGSSGFIGSELTSLLKNLGHEVVALGRKASEAIDFLRPESWEKFIKKNDHVVFLIAPAAGEEEKHIEAFNYLLNVCTKKEIRHFLYISSGGSIYGNNKAPSKETDNLHPHSPYGRLKKQSEDILNDQHFPFAIARPSNIYGERQNPNRRFGAITTFYHQIKNNIPLNIYGNLSITKDYLHVEDLVEALCILLLEEKKGIYNLGFGTSHSLKEIISSIEEVTGNVAQIQFFPMASTDIPFYQLDCSKAKKELNWEAKINIKEGILRYKDKT
jgi:UDP-glucose 4-epimerase